MRYSYKKALDILADYALSEGFLEVTFDHPSVSTLYPNHLSPTYEPRRIKIEGKYNYELQTYLLLHELGHHEIRKDWDTFAETFPIAARAEARWEKGYSRNLRRRKDYFVTSFEEEYKAWDEGLKLAQAYDIPINEKRWHKLRTDCLFSYMKYYSTLRN